MNYSSDTADHEIHGLFMKPLIVGASGLIGTALVENFRNRGMVVWGSSRKRSSSQTNIIRLDLLKATDTKLSRLLPSGISHLFDCTGAESLKFCEEHPVEAKKIILTGAQSLATWANQSKAIMIYLSTSLVFDGQSNFVSSENSKSPNGIYAKLKSSAEDIVLTSSSRNSVIRFEKILHVNTPVLTHWKAQLENDVEVTAFVDRKLSPITLMGAVTAIDIVSTRNMSGITQLSSTTEITYYDLALRLAKKMNVSANLIKPVTSESHGVAQRLHSTLNSDRIANEQPSLMRSAEDCVDHVIDELIQE